MNQISPDSEMLQLDDGSPCPDISIQATSDGRSPVLHARAFTSGGRMRAFTIDVGGHRTATAYLDGRVASDTGRAVLEGLVPRADRRRV